MYADLYLESEFEYLKLINSRRWICNGAENWQTHMIPNCLRYLISHQQRNWQRPSIIWLTKLLKVMLL